MAVSFYFDEMMPRTAAEQLTIRGYRVIMAVDVGMVEKDDPEHLVYATEHGYITVTFDRAFAGKTLVVTQHGGLICLSGTQDNIGSIVRKLTTFAENHSIEDSRGQVFWL